MSATLAEIAKFYQKTITTSQRFNSSAPNTDRSLLYPPFLSKVDLCINIYKNSHSNQDIAFTETYRSNALQLIHYNNGASKIKKDGMHHFGVAADCIFVIGGRKTYKGDILGLRQIFKTNGLFVLGMWDALHVQYIPVKEQISLRNEVKKLFP